MLQTQILQTGGTRQFFQNIEKQIRKKPESKQECIICVKCQSKNKESLAVWQVCASVC